MWPRLPFSWMFGPYDFLRSLSTGAILWFWETSWVCCPRVQYTSNGEKDTRSCKIIRNMLEQFWWAWGTFWMMLRTGQPGEGKKKGQCFIHARGCLNSFVISTRQDCLYQVGIPEKIFSSLFWLPPSPLNPYPLQAMWYFLNNFLLLSILRSLSRK